LTTFARSRPNDDVEADAGTVTRLLHDWRAGDLAAFDRLVPLVYPDLRRLAVLSMRGERKAALQPTELISELYLKLFGDQAVDWANRAHFYAVAARNMRQILVDHARQRATAKRSGEPVTLEDGMLLAQTDEALVALDDALRSLAEVDERKARAVELRYFGGLTQQEIADVLRVHVNTIAHDLRLAEAWLHHAVRTSL
jgi:RNA polymerase sigma factor (TIGR02999 family)